VGDYLKEWLEQVIRVRRRPRTFDSYEARVRLHLIPELGHIRLTKLETRDLRALYAKKLQAGLSPTTVNNIHLILHAALKTAQREQLVTVNVADLVDPPAPAEFEARHLSLDEATRMLTLLRDHPLGPLWTFIFGTGVRIGEAAALTWSDVNLEAGVAVVSRGASRHSVEVDGRVRWIQDIAQTKSRRSRRALSLPPFVVVALRAQQTRVKELRLRAGPKWRNELDLVFPSAIGTLLRSDKVLDRFKTALESVGIEPRRIHDLRHSLAQLMLDTGSAELATVSRMLGHSQIGTTDGVYIRGLDEAQRTAAERFGRLFPVQESVQDDATNGAT
jgi:integrase